ncbi:M23 family metallopeptidase [Paenarthrobacter ureafaciens]|uniref:M23 family metallopeptidase n=1 Tax=Paenarthrobacter ureafaciens TaxID=37931 RepID=UPI0009AC37BC|nr:M23 family metallopeptidase [Paenarthrobacter ureafaciens]GLU58562.1 hypothetical protein Pure01_10750 [Paenarthrobacter ureafaciens]GLU61807.1 hypothetical protein Pure02_00570 [Paenarthrobacter ureafaciens]GLU66081.1 hypothetical protein Pure03_00570 [Paenarthrobacter ureafaciens]GLU71595.1 hypothetical protein Pure04_13100 [Paenarthrobacter ureafaciens]GLU74618.1 hypothetical protein Pure05_00580 [Paenarthrobacter ureafaciens]
MTLTLVPPSRGHITQRFGARQIDGNPHAGQDYAYTNGRDIFPEIYAAADGVVLFAGDSRGLAWPNIMYLNIDFDRTDNVDTSAGNYIIIAHTDGGVRVALTGYGHLEQVWVKAGQVVKAGQQIGVCGETGFSAGKHLHFDLVISPFRVDAAPYYGRVDPNPYFKGGASLGYAGSTKQEEDDMYTDADRARDTLAAARVDYLWEHYGPAKSGYKTEGSMERILLDTQTAAQATLTSVTPGVSGGRTAGATVQAMVAIAANSQGKTVEEIVDGVSEKLSDGVEFVLQPKQEG